MDRIAVIATGGKQYVVKEGQTLVVEKLGAAGSVSFDALLIGGDAVKLGTPNVSGAKVTATVLGQGKADKVIIRKFKAKVRYRRKRGHRQQFSKVRIEKIEG